MGQNSKKNKKNAKRAYEYQNRNNFKNQNHTPPKMTVRRDFALQNAEMQKIATAMQELKSRKTVCKKCGKEIDDISSAISDRVTSAPIHFDCAMNEIRQYEKVRAGERLVYIGNGKFAIIKFENEKDLKNFKIVKTIEWEKSDAPKTWREEMMGLYSRVV